MRCSALLAAILCSTVMAQNAPDPAKPAPDSKTAPPAASQKAPPPPPLALPDGPVPCYIFSDNCVLQRDMKCPVWGYADPDAKVAVAFAGQTVTAAADKDGRWRAVLDPLKASKDGRDMTIAAGGKTVTIHNVRVGDVWLCAGQSNMDLSFDTNFSDPKLAPKEAAQNVWIMLPGTNRTGAAVYDVHRTKTWPPEEHRVPDSWKPATPEWAMKFSMIGFYFGRDVAKLQDVPVGMINIAVGTTTVGIWCSADADAAARGSKARPTPTSRYADDAAGGKKGPLLYDGMIHPLVGLAMKGMLWYQGESEAMWFFNAQYDKWFVAMIKDYRAKWGIGDFPFLFVQHQAGAGGGSVAVREMQARGLTQPNTAMIVIADVSGGLHPADKRPVAERLLLGARALAYGEKIECMGPIYKAHTVEGDKVRITFDHVGTGLMAKDGKPLSAAAPAPFDPRARGPAPAFLIAGADEKFYPADAAIDGQSVVVSNPAVPAPVAVRYAWAISPSMTLYNKEGLPAAPFRTDPDKPVEINAPPKQTN